jgi:hypothetical protein
MPRLEQWKHRAEIAAAALASICFGVSFGYNYGVDNQVVYMLGALRLLDPSILTRDWFATQTTHYHPAFKFVAAALIALSRRGLAVGVAQTIVIALGMMGLYALLRALCPDRRVALPSFLLLLAINFITRTYGAGATYVFDWILQPSTLASAAFFAALPFFVRGRYLASSVCVAVSGLFHANYLLLLIMSFGMAHLFMGRRGLAGRLVLQFTLPALVLLLFLPMILSTARAPEAHAAQAIYMNIRAPHHFVPSGYERDFTPFIAWHMIGLGASLHLVQRDERTRRLALLIAGLLLVIWTGVVLSTWVHISQATQLFPWRIGPHAVMLLEVLASLGAISWLLAPGSAARATAGQIALLIGGLATLAMTGGNRDQPALANLLLAVTLGVLVFKAIGTVAAFAPERVRAPLSGLWARAGGGVVLAAVLVALGLAAKDPMMGVQKRSTVWSGINRDEAELCRWMRESSPRDALFLTPPGVESLRFHGQRAIVVDWKSNPIVPGEVMEWFRRLKDVTGRPNFSGSRDLDGYNTMDTSRLEALRARYNFDFVVVRRGQEASLGHRTVFANNRFAVLDVRKDR